MHIARLCLVLTLALAAAPASGADAGIVTIADGNARVLRGSVWYKLAAGTPFQDGDVVDAGERTTVQIELPAAGMLNLVGPGALYAASAPAPGGGRDSGELGLDRGWLKFAATAPGARVRTPTALVTVSDAIVVMHQDNRLLELFVETGTARIQESARGGRDAAPHEAKAGEYWTRDGDKPFSSERRAPVKFVASMPRHQIDRLMSLAAKYKGKAPPLVADREITLAEAEPWLTGPYRRAFSKRLGSRLADPAFRKAVEANIAAYPEFDRVLHPEKYPAVAAPTGVGAPNAATPVPASASAPPAASIPGAPKGATAPAAAAAGASPAAPPKATAPAPAPAAPPPKSNLKTGALRMMPLVSLLLPDAPEAIL